VCKLIEVEIELWWCGGGREHRINRAYISVVRSLAGRPGKPLPGVLL
jgi:hypothetical protein